MSKVMACIPKEKVQGPFVWVLLQVQVLHLHLLSAYSPKFEPPRRAERLEPAHAIVEASIISNTMVSVSDF